MNAPKYMPSLPLEWQYLQDVTEENGHEGKHASNDARPSDSDQHEGPIRDIQFEQLLEGDGRVGLLLLLPGLLPATTTLNQTAQGTPSLLSPLLLLFCLSKPDGSFLQR